MRSGHQEGVELVVIDGTAEFDQVVARRVLEEWLMLEPGRVYFRVDHPSSRSVALFGVDDHIWSLLEIAALLD